MESVKKAIVQKKLYRQESSIVKALQLELSDFSEQLDIMYWISNCFLMEKKLFCVDT